MGNYYSGMIRYRENNYIAHYRTKGSKNGYSTTEGYIPVGKPKMAQKPSNSIGRPQKNAASSHENKALNDRFGDLFNDYKRNATMNLAKNYAPALIGNYLKSRVSDVKEKAKQAGSNISDFGKRIYERRGDLKNAAKFVAKTIAAKKAKELAQKGQKYAEEKIDDFLKSRSNRKYRQNVLPMTDALTSASKNIVKGLAETIIDKKKLKTAESKFNSIREKYDEAYLKQDWNEVKKIEKNLDKAYEEYKTLLDMYGY